VTINVLNPGLVDPSIRREMHWLLRFLMERVFGRFWLMTPAEGARMPLRLALDPEFAGVSGGLFNHRGKRLRPAARVRDPVMGGGGCGNYRSACAANTSRQDCGRTDRVQPPGPPTGA
jgi:hypothetical protein